MRVELPRLAGALVALAMIATGCSDETSTGPGSTLTAGRGKLTHVVIIMQENRSFDTYFGTFPGADGIPMQNGVPTVCNPDPATGGCDRPYHNTKDLDYGGPHGSVSAAADIDGGKMDGFVAAAEQAVDSNCTKPFDPACIPVDSIDVMGYKDESDIPNYWAYAKNFVLQDRMFEPNISWSLPEHLFLVSGWSAICSIRDNPMSCVSELSNPDGTQMGHVVPDPNYAWTDLTYLLHKYGVTWKYYLAEGYQPDCDDDDAVSCPKQRQDVSVPEIWNPLPWFTTVRQDGETGNIQKVDQFFLDVRNGTLPAVSWIIPNALVSEHPDMLVSNGQAYVTTLINAVMQSPAWDSTAVLLSWDDWGGFYDHVPPLTVDQNGYGLRVPGLVISPYAKAGYVDHQTLSHDAYLKFIEDVFLGGQRLDPRTDGRPDTRPTVREAVPALGDLLSDFDFDQPPRPPLILQPFLPRSKTLPDRAGVIGAAGRD